MANNTYNINYTSPKILELDPLVLTGHVTPTANTEYQRGDLLVLDNAGVATHATTGADWHVVCAVDITADEASRKLANKKGMPVITMGKVDVGAVTLKGTPLTAEQQTTAWAYSMRTGSIKLEYTVGGA